MKPSNSSRPAERKTLNIVGGGKVARTLGHLWTMHGPFVVQDVLNRSQESAACAVTFIGAGRAISDYREFNPADVWLIGTNDDQIVPSVAALMREQKFALNTTIFHCSGAKSSIELKSIVGPERFVASVHPIRSFASPEQVSQSFAGTYCGMEGDPEALTILSQAFAAIGGQLVAIDPQLKTLYHAGAVFACNYLVTLMDVAQQAYVRSGVPPEVALKLMEPLVRETVDNIFNTGPLNALTGPIARGDVRTVVHQYRAVTAWDKRHGKLYKQLGKLTASLAKRRLEKNP